MMEYSIWIELAEVHVEEVKQFKTQMRMVLEYLP